MKDNIDAELAEPGKHPGGIRATNALPLWKRVMDLACVLIALPLVLPLMVLITLIIKCASRGPVFFSQDRLGYRGGRFRCYKYRTMRQNADTEVHREHLTRLMRSDVPMTKLDAKGDARLIPLGALLRAMGLDELPQLYNVLRGEMSLVGPRPCLPYEYENFAGSYHGRFDAVPGLTGLWQVNGKNRTTFARMVELDILYTRIKSPWLDLAILLRTGPALLSQVLELQFHRTRLLGTSAPSRSASTPRSVTPVASWSTHDK